MTLNPRRIIVQVTDCDGASIVFTDAVAVRSTSQNVEEELSYLAYRDFTENQSYSESIRKDILDALERGRALHE